MLEKTGTEPYAGASQWPEISDYALIGDCRTAALIGRDGGIDWMCLPDFSSPAFFARILDRDRAGRFVVGPGRPVASERSYVGDSNVLQTSFRIGGGELRLTDGMTIPPALEAPQLLPQRELLRSIEAIGAEVPVDVVYEPTPDYGRSDVRLSRCGTLGWACAYRDHLLLLHTDMPLELSADRRCLRGRFTLASGERRHLSLTYVRNDIGVVLPLGRFATQRMSATVDWWKAWADRCTYSGPYRSAVVRSVLVLKLLTYCLSGAVIAAPTASLPETVGGSRNWDYRYCWLRDASMTLEAFLDLGFWAEANAFLGWLLHATRLTWPKLQVLYDLHGEARVPETSLDHLEGYRGSRPVRIGNGAWNQLQLDVYGSLIMAAASYVMRGHQLSRDDCSMLAGLGKTVIREWRKPDHGIWEFRGAPRHNTYSKVTCWAALDCLADLAERGVLSVPIEQFRQERDAIREIVEADGFNTELDSYVGSFGTEVADASLLLLPRYRYCEAADPRMAGTMAYLDRQLATGALLYRYREGTDELEGHESPFGICSFWAVETLARA
ncbi:MAG TPA: glycoside hydrolase family 15 protein, partial [Burkholderiales bacterium]|nr:glycoside hydrolase family 15 protein [Burkholderiales bacterium]